MELVALCGGIVLPLARRLTELQLPNALFAALRHYGYKASDAMIMSLRS